MFCRVLVHIDRKARVMDYLDSIPRSVDDMLNGAFVRGKTTAHYHRLAILWALVHALDPEGTPWELKLGQCPPHMIQSMDCGVIVCARPYYFLHDVHPFPMHFGSLTNTTPFREFLANVLTKFGNRPDDLSDFVVPDFSFEAVKEPVDEFIIPVENEDSVEIVSISPSLKRLQRFPASKPYFLAFFRCRCIPRGCVVWNSFVQKGMY
jgi:hypothetical protein